MKRVLFQNIVQPLHSACNKFPFETACCSVALLAVRSFVPDEHAAEATRFCRVHRHHHHPRRAATASPAVVAVDHSACGTPRFPTRVMDMLFACNHILLSHLVSGDAVTVIVEQALRKAMSQSCDFFVVLNLVVANMQARARKCRQHTDTCFDGYAFEAVTVTFQNYLLVDHAGAVTQLEDEVEQVLPCQWSITFPARKTFAAFLANRQLWQRLDHVPAFNALEVGQTAAAEMKRVPSRHSASPVLCRLLLTRQRTGADTADGAGTPSSEPGAGIGSSRPA